MFRGEALLEKTDRFRRELLQVMGGAALAAPFRRILVPASLNDARENPTTPTPKIALELGSTDDAGMRRVKQLGVNHVLTGGPPIPWQEADLQMRMDKLKKGGLTLGNMMIDGFPKTLYGKPGRDEEIDKVQQSIRAAGQVGLL